uniref:Uncharacterized protein n=1 Tax=Oryza barthii TaxID=65489 RepID=A0A679B9V6_9ORYZ|nr:hypothetical protein [Oryza barthii]
MSVWGGRKPTSWAVKDARAASWRSLTRAAKAAAGDDAGGVGQKWKRRGKRELKGGEKGALLFAELGRERDGSGSSASRFWQDTRGAARARAAELAAGSGAERQRGAGADGGGDRAVGHDWRVRGNQRRWRVQMAATVREEGERARERGREGESGALSLDSIACNACARGEEGWEGRGGLD